MIDLRYHLISLVSVFLALALGLILGIAIGQDDGVSLMQEGLIRTLSADMRALEESRARLADSLAYQDTLIGAMGERVETLSLHLLQGRLDGEHIGVIMGYGKGASDLNLPDYADSLEMAGAEVHFIAEMRVDEGSEVALDTATVAALLESIVGPDGPDQEEEQGHRLLRRSRESHRVSTVIIFKDQPIGEEIERLEEILTLTQGPVRVVRSHHEIESAEGTSQNVLHLSRLLRAFEIILLLEGMGSSED